MTTRPTELWEGSGTERITALSDGVFAIAITLLVLDLRLPHLSPEATAGELTKALLDLTPRIFTYVLSFTVIGLVWMTHHRLFSLIKRYDNALLWLNLLVLLFVAFLPFPTMVLGEYVDLTPAVVLYAATFLGVSLSQLLLWLYASHGRRLVDPALDPRLVAQMTGRGVAGVVIWLLSIPLAFVSPSVGTASWALMVIAIPVAERAFYRSQAVEEQPPGPAGGE